MLSHKLKTKKDILSFFLAPYVIFYLKMHPVQETSSHSFLLLLSLFSIFCFSFYANTLLLRQTFRLL